MLKVRRSVSRDIHVLYRMVGHLLPSNTPARCRCVLKPPNHRWQQQVQLYQNHGNHSGEKDHPITGHVPAKSYQNHDAYQHFLNVLKLIELFSKLHTIRGTYKIYLSCMIINNTIKWNCVLILIFGRICLSMDIHVIFAAWIMRRFLTNQLLAKRYWGMKANKLRDKFQVHTIAFGQ